MSRCLVLFGCLTVVFGLVCLPGAAESPRATPEVAGKGSQPEPARACFERYWNISELVLDKGMDPPTRQEMFLGGVRALFAQARTNPPADLSRQVSRLTSEEQFASFLRENWPAPNGDPSTAPSALERAFVHGVLERLPGQLEARRFHPRLLSSAEARVEVAAAANRYVGVGIQVRFDPKEERTQIVIPFAGAPARLAGARPSDLILAVDGVNTQGMKLQEVVERLRGEEGSQVTMTVRQPEEKEERLLKMTRSPVPFQTVLGWQRLGEDRWQFQVNGDEPIAYLRVSNLLPSTPFELRKVERTLLESGIKALVLDLRSGSTSDLKSAALTADALLDGGLMWRVRDAQGHVKEYRADRDCLFRDCPLVLLVNAQTFGAAEFVAAALKDNGRAVVVGEPSLGDGSVHTLHMLPDGQGALEFRTARVVRAAPAKDASRSGNGDWRPVQPDHVVPLSAAQLKPIYAWHEAQVSPEPLPGAAKMPPEDPQLAKALEILRTALKK
jgi:carboxyl-terminal processing protease